MFRRKKKNGDGEDSSADAAATGPESPMGPPPARRDPPATPAVGRTASPTVAQPRADASRRAAEPTRRAGVFGVPTPITKPDNPESKRLTVGREISLAGEITACEVLVVEGKVEASLVGSRLIEVAPGGLFKGSAVVESAEIAGRFEGALTVHDRLLVRATGHVSGSVKYRRLEVEQGGEIVGEMAVERPAEPEAKETAAE